MRHLPTVHDQADIYTPADADVPFVHIDTAVLQARRQEIYHFIERFGVREIVYAANPRSAKTRDVLFPNEMAGVHFRPDARLNNILQPEWAGRSNEEIRSSSLYTTWHTQPLSVHFEGGETLQHVKSRVQSLLEDLEYKASMVISHTTPMQVLLCGTLNLPLDRIWAFKFDHWSFSVVYESVLLRHNAQTLSDITLSDIRLA